MLNGIFLLFHQTLRRDAREMRKHVVMGIVVSITCLNLLYAHLFSTFMSVPGLRLFQLTTWMNVVLIGLCGIGTFATAITEEKEENMLGLLRLAGINVVSLLLGKSTSRLVHIFYLLWIQFPFTLLAVTLGGITVSQIVAVYVMLFAFAFFVANVGLLCSVVFPRSGKSSAFVFLILGFFFATVPVGRRALQSLGPNTLIPAKSGLANWMTDCVTFLSPMTLTHQFSEIFDFGYKGGVLNPSVAFMFASGSSLFILAWLVFERCNRDQVVARVRTPFSTRLKQIVLRSKKEQRIDRFGRPWKDAIAWKEYYFSGLHTRKMWVSLLAYLLLIVVIGYIHAHAAGRFPLPPRAHLDAVEASTFFVGLLLCLELAFFCSNLMGQEIHGKTWGAFVLIPQSFSRKFFSKCKGGFLRFFPGLFWLTVCLWELQRLSPRSISIFEEEGFWVLIVEVLIFYQLLVYLSLRLKWSVLPIALAVFWLGNIALIPLLSITESMLSSFLPEYLRIAWIAFYVGGIISFALQIMIVQQLNRVTEQNS